MYPESSFDKIADAQGYQIRRHELVELMDHNPIDYRAAVVESMTHTRDTEVKLVHTHLPKLADMDLV